MGDASLSLASSDEINTVVVVIRDLRYCGDELARHHWCIPDVPHGPNTASSCAAHSREPGAQSSATGPRGGRRNTKRMQQHLRAFHDREDVSPAELLDRWQQSL